MLREIDWWLNCALETLVKGSKLEVERGEFQVPIFSIRSGPLQASTKQVHNIKVPAKYHPVF